jgi:DivIVA domain-containing protein
MPPVEFDRQAIERRDFPMARRGYDPGAVDAHLRALGAEFEQLQRHALNGGADVSLASTAGVQVQSILQAAESAAAEIEQQALDAARQARESADREAEQTREQAIEQARAHVTAVSAVAASLLERVGSMDGEVNSLIESLRAGAGRLAVDLSAVEAGMGELYDAASGRTVAEEPHGADFRAELREAIAPPAAAAPALAPEYDPPAPVAEQASPAGDVDGARLIALNMALNGESRADTERYLAENFQIPDRDKLVDEVYAAIDG